ncbi:MAG: hypothetical protein K8T89_22095 [Planctomycetes bacterium]|nr:hypothetical protein [Planctomycetota bacterium]
MIIPYSELVRETGGILHLPDALEQHRGAILLPYNRTSTYKQAGTSNIILQAKTDAVVDETFRLAPEHAQLVAVQGVEEGKLSVRRKWLIEAAEQAKPNGSIIVAADLSRFLRPESYHRRTNPDAWPTAEEFAWLHEITLGVPLATLAHPTLIESQRHGLATKRTGRAGRPSSMTDELAKWIFCNLGCRCNGRWSNSIRSVAEYVGVSLGLVQRLLNKKIPCEACCQSERGLRWKDVHSPICQFRIVRKILGRPIFG